MILVFKDRTSIDLPFGAKVDKVDGVPPEVIVVDPVELNQQWACINEKRVREYLLMLSNMSMTGVQIISQSEVHGKGQEMKVN